MSSIDLDTLKSNEISTVSQSEILDISPALDTLRGYKH